jgi:hypothetical protein
VSFWWDDQGVLAVNGKLPLGMTNISSDYGGDERGFVIVVKKVSKQDMLFIRIQVILYTSIYGREGTACL